MLFKLKGVKVDVVDTMFKFVFKYEQLENFEKPYLNFCFKTYFKTCSLDIRFWQSKTGFPRMLFYSLGQKDFPQRHQTKKKHGIALIFGDEWNQIHLLGSDVC